MPYFKARLVDTACFSCSHCKLFTETRHTSVLCRVTKKELCILVTTAFLCTAAWGSRHVAQICLHTWGPCIVWGISTATRAKTKSQHYHFRKVWEHPITFLSGPKAFSNVIQIQTAETPGNYYTGCKTTLFLLAGVIFPGLATFLAMVIYVILEVFMYHSFEWLSH